MANKTDGYELVKPTLTDAADITQTNNNWEIIEDALENITLRVENLQSNTSNSVNALETTLKQYVNNEVAKLQPKITYGTASPSGGSNGDIYIKII